jgi:hypothetical protein
MIESARGLVGRSIVPNTQKGNKLDCETYRAVVLLCIMHKAMCTIVAKKSTAHTEHLLADYQNGFRKNRSAADYTREVQESIPG